MKPLLAFMVLVLGVFSTHQVALADHGIVIDTPYAFATSEMQKNGAAFFSLENHSDENDRLIGATSDIAERVELHTHEMDGSIMQMREVDGYDISAGDSVSLKPMGHHIMFMGLKAPLEEGSSFALKLDFENAGEKIISVDVIKPGTSPDGDHTCDCDEDKESECDCDCGCNEDGKECTCEGDCECDCGCHGEKHHKHGDHWHHDHSKHGHDHDSHHSENSEEKDHKHGDHWHHDHEAHGHTHDEHHQ